MIDILDAAKYFLSLNDYEASGTMTQLKLQKLCYYAQAMSLVHNDNLIFDTKFEAWQWGPVSKRLYDTYKQFGKNNIPNPGKLTLKINDKDKKILDLTWDKYGCYDAPYLVKSTHKETPWIKARNEGYSKEIDYDEMKFFYKSQLKSKNRDRFQAIESTQDLLDQITPNNLHPDLFPSKYRVDGEFA